MGELSTRNGGKWVITQTELILDEFCPIIHGGKKILKNIELTIFLQDSLVFTPSADFRTIAVQSIEEGKFVKSIEISEFYR